MFCLSQKDCPSPCKVREPALNGVVSLFKQQRHLVFTRPFASSEPWLHARFRLDVAGLASPVRESFRDETLEGLENRTEDETFI